MPASGRSAAGATRSCARSWVRRCRCRSVGMVAAAMTGRREGARDVTRVVICDDAPDHRALVRAVLADEPDVEVVGEAADGDTCMTAIALTDPDVLVLDLHMPGSDGFKVL